MCAAYNLSIPHLKVGQKVSDWRTLYTSATALLEEKQKVGFLPVAVDRSTADQEWTAEAAKHETLKDALNELQIRLDGKKTRLVAMTEFFRLKPRDDKMLNQHTLSTFFFEVLEVGHQAKLTNDVIAMKFLEYIPGAAKLYSDNEKEITEEMTNAKLIEFFDVVKERLSKGKDEVLVETIAEEVFHVNSTSEEKVPRWAENLQAEVSALKSSLKNISSTESTSDDQNEAFYYKKDGKNYKKKSYGPCSICKKDNHTEKKCFKRECKKCGGRGHDEDKCASRIKNRNSKR